MYCMCACAPVIMCSSSSCRNVQECRVRAHRICCPAEETNVNHYDNLKAEGVS
jgi:hypothetical protein